MLSLLVQAAEFVENQSKLDNCEQEHGYASRAFVVENEPFKPKMKSSRKSHNRTTHNEIEKNRRAHLRSCLDNLKAIVPLREDSTRHTTLGLLNQASVLIKDLQREHLTLAHAKTQECQRNVLLKRTLLRLSASRKRTNSTGSSWSSGLSESSTDSDKDDEIIDVTDCSVGTNALKAALHRLPANLITINVPKAIALASRSTKMTNVSV